MKASFYPQIGLIKSRISPIIPDSDVDNYDINYITNMAKHSYLYINPDSWSDSKSANWIKHQIPGRSDPIQQWMAGGVRTVSFDALVTNDLAQPKEYKVENTFAQKITKSFGEKLGSIAMQMFNIPSLSLYELLGSGDPNIPSAMLSSEELSIANRLDYYRSLVYPRIYGVKTNSPLLVRLEVGSSLGFRNTVSTESFAVEKVEIKITKQYPNLAPIEAIVSLVFTEVVDITLSANNTF